MSENPAPQPSSNEPYQSAKPKVKWAWWKTTALIVISVATIGLTIWSSIVHQTVREDPIYFEHPAPAYVGEAPLAISSLSEANNSNNDFILVITPCGDAALNAQITEITVKAANRIRTTDRIYVGVFILPQNASLTYPTVYIKLFTEQASKYPLTMRSDITQDNIFNQFLNRKYLRGG